MWYGANWKPSTKTTGFLNGSTGVKTYYAVTCTVGDPANVWFFGAPKTPNIFFLNADQILYSRRFIRHTSPKTNMDTRNGLEKVDSFWIWPSLVSMLDFWGVPFQINFFHLRKWPRARQTGAQDGYDGWAWDLWKVSILFFGPQTTKPRMYPIFCHVSVDVIFSSVSKWWVLKLPFLKLKIQLISWFSSVWWPTSGATLVVFCWWKRPETTKQREHVFWFVALS